MRILGCVVLMTLCTMAEVPVLKGELADEEKFPRNDGREMAVFAGCADCVGPWTVSASGKLPIQDGNSYKATNLTDNDFLTCWALEDTKESWFGISQALPGRNNYTPIRGFSLVNGYAKSPERWGQNSRARSLRITINEVVVARVKLLDSASIQKVRFPEPIFLKDHDLLRFTVESSYPGSYFRDVCISEFQLDAGH